MLGFNSPKFAYNHDLDKLVFYFYLDDFPNQQQSFDVDVNALFKAYYIAKDYHRKVGNVVCDYLSSKGTLSPRLSKVVPLVLNNVVINPTLIRKALHQNKKLSRKLDLKIKVGSGNWDRSVPHNHSQRKVDAEEVERCKHNMNVAVLKARKFDAYQPFFNQFVDAYKELTFAEKGVCVNIGPRLYTKLFNSFRNLIDFNEDVKL